MYKKMLVIASLVFAGSLVAAAGAQAITIIPPSLEFEVSPGQEYETSVKLFNETDAAVDLYTEATSFGAAGESGKPSYRFDAEPEDLSSWLTIEEGPFHLEPGDRITVPITVTPPENAGPGGHYAAVFFSNTPPEAQSGGQIAVGTKIGILLLARVPGDVIEAGDIKEFILQDDATSANRLPLTFVTRYENSGNVHLRPTGMIEVNNMFGNAVASLEFNPSNGATLPQTIRKYETVWQKGDVSTDTGFWAEFKNERKNFAIGRYTAAISTQAGIDTTINKSATLTFWVLPWHVMIVWGIGIIIILVLLWLLLRRYNKWIVAKAMQRGATDTQSTPPTDKK
ncbi:MAG: hypothetical protein ACOYUK_04665 [Patescibacteria group bacterium]